jgi:hypothetical protein
MEIENELLKKSFQFETKKDYTVKDKSLITIYYNKKWLILFSILIVLLILYLYMNNIINIPILCIPLNKKYNLFNKSNKSTCDTIIELNNADDWNLESEINDFMELQENYIQLSNN